jgi:hypothetical protein
MIARTILTRTKLGVFLLLYADSHYSNGYLQYCTRNPVSRCGYCCVIGRVCVVAGVVPTPEGRRTGP